MYILTMHIKNYSNYIKRMIVTAMTH